MIVQNSGKSCSFPFSTIILTKNKIATGHRVLIGTQNFIARIKYQTKKTGCILNKEKSNKTKNGQRILKTNNKVQQKGLKPNHNYGLSFL